MQPPSGGERVLVVAESRADVIEHAAAVLQAHAACTRIDVAVVVAPPPTLWWCIPLGPGGARVMAGWCRDDDCTRAGRQAAALAAFVPHRAAARVALARSWPAALERAGQYDRVVVVDQPSRRRDRRRVDRALRAGNGSRTANGTRVVANTTAPGADAAVRARPSRVS